MATNNAANQSNLGVQSLTSAGAFNGRTITGTSNQISVTNGNGTAGNPTLALTSTIYVSGISFDSGSNTLSSYANSTFNPTITSSGGGESVGYSTQVGRYTKIGNTVFIDIAIELSSLSGGSGTVRVSSLPFTSSSTFSSAGSIYLDNVTFGAGVFYYSVNLGASSTFATIAGTRSAAARLGLAWGLINNTSKFHISMIYSV